MKQRDVSYDLLAELSNMFCKQVDELSVEFPDEEMRQQCEFDYIDQYINGDDNPTVRCLW